MLELPTAEEYARGSVKMYNTVRERGKEKHQVRSPLLVSMNINDCAARASANEPPKSVKSTRRTTQLEF